MNDADLLLDRVHKKLKAWQNIYEVLGQEFEYRRPTEEEMDRYIMLYVAQSYKKPPKKPKKD
jgi:DNA/RNA-binding domain of Phe-tRNA-synthetase-like protein